MGLNNYDIVELLRKNIALFEGLDEVYLFGSVLDAQNEPNDVDLLLIYTHNLDRVIEKIGAITSVLEKLTGIPVDLTVLSAEEEKDTQFLKRIYSHCLKLK